MTNTLSETLQGDGFAAGTLDSLGEGPGFRKIRTELGVQEMGVNAIVLPPKIGGGTHWHDRQEEVYFVHTGTLRFTMGENDEHEVILGPGGVIRIDAKTHRSVANIGEGEATYIVFGAAGGYVGRDGHHRENEPRVREVTT